MKKKHKTSDAGVSQKTDTMILYDVQNNTISFADALVGISIEKYLASFTDTNLPAEQEKSHKKSGILLDTTGFAAKLAKKAPSVAKYTANIFKQALSAEQYYKLKLTGQMGAVYRYGKAVGIIATSDTPSRELYKQSEKIVAASFGGKEALKLAMPYCTNLAKTHGKKAIYSVPICLATATLLGSSSAYTFMDFINQLSIVDGFIVV